MPTSASGLKIGFGEADLTPPFPHPMAGFGQARTACHTGVHDPIAARAAFFDCGTESVVLVSCEVIGLKAEGIALVREAIPDSWGLPPERVLISCTHTHGGPVIEGEYVPFLVRQIVCAIELARADRKPRSLHTGSAAHEEWTGFNRRHLETGFLPVDREASAVFVCEKPDTVCGVLFHYACHPSVLGPDNLQITADWPGYARRVVQEHLGREIPVLFLQGTSGDINAGYSAGVSALGIPLPNRTFEIAERIGRIVARTVAAAWKQARPSRQQAIRFARQMRPLKYRDADNLSELRQSEAAWARRVEELRGADAPMNQLMHAKVENAYARFAIAAAEFVGSAGVAHVEAEQIAVRIGEFALLTFPGEFFVGSGLRIKRETAVGLVLPLGICGDYLGYVPDADAFVEGGYEVACARFAPSTADEWVDAGLDLLASLAAPG